MDLPPLAAARSPGARPRGRAGQRAGCALHGHVYREAGLALHLCLEGHTGSWPEKGTSWKETWAEEHRESGLASAPIGLLLLPVFISRRQDGSAPGRPYVQSPLLAPIWRVTDEEERIMVGHGVGASGWLCRGKPGRFRRDGSISDLYFSLWFKGMCVWSSGQEGLG